MDLDVDQLLLCICGCYFDKHISGNIMGISFALSLLRHGILRAMNCGVRSSY